MTAVEKTGKKKKNKGKKSKKKNETESEVLERVMDSIEMAGASLEFFDEEGGESEEVKAQEPNAEEVVEAAANEDVALEAESAEDVEMEAAQGDETSEELEASSEEGTEEVIEEEVSEDLSEAETMEMLPEENSDVEFVEHKQALSILESILFSSDRPLGMGTFKQVFKGTNYKTKEIKNALEALQVEYADLSRGVTLEEISGGWQLRTKVDNMDFLRKLAKARPFKLSGPALEVLAIIAYKQPMIKSEVDDIRGVESGHLVRALMEKGLVCFQGKSELPGKPMQYGTTRKFLDIFGLRNLRELPSLDEIDQLLPDGIGIEEDDEKLSDVTEKMAEEFEGSYSEGQEELEKIEATLGDIDTSSEFFEEEKRRQKEKRDRDRARDIREALDVGEEVETKEVRWLERYEEKLKAEEEMAQAAAASDSELSEESIDPSAAPQDDRVETQGGIVGAENLDQTVEGLKTAMEESFSDALIEEPESLTDELSELSEEPLVSEEVMAADEAQDFEDEVLYESHSEPSEESIDPSAAPQDDRVEAQGKEFDPFAEEDGDSKEV